MANMKPLKSISRRNFLRFGGVGSALILTTPHLLSCTTKRSRNNAISSNFDSDVEIVLTATRDEVSIFQGEPTRVWTYKGELLKGEEKSLQILEETYLGPIIRVRKGQKIRIHFNNEIDEESIIHWHGLHVPEEADGHPRFVIPNGREYVYEFEVKDRAGTYWYHPHPHRRTGPQVYCGLAGLFLISDEEEEHVELPTGNYDIPLVIQDRTFDGDNQLVYIGKGMMDRMNGFLGEQIIVNGKLDYTLSVSTRVYRLRLLNGSNSRIYKLAWSDGTPLTIIGTDGGLLEKPVSKPYLMLGPAERIDLWVDFSRKPVGTELVMKSLSFSGTMAGGMGGMMGRRDNALPNGAEFPVFKVRVEKKEGEKLQLPQRLSSIDRYELKDAVNRDNPRTFRFFMQRMNWTINGRVFGMENVADDEMVTLDTTEVWELMNNTGGIGMMGGMMTMPHPVHIHGLQFQIINRNVDDIYDSGWKSTREGFVDDGWKDSVLLMPGMRVKILLRFRDYAGLYLYHCHNLEHEDMGMMRNYFISP